MLGTLRVRGTRLAVSAGALVLVTSLVRAGGGTIDVEGATLSVGAAPSRGTIVIDEHADLPASPPLSAVPTDGGDPADSFAIHYYDRAPELTAGFGGPDFVVDRDMTFPGGMYDFGRLEVQQGRTLRFTGEATLRAAGDLVIDGRITMAGTGTLRIDALGGLTMTGHAGSVETGIVTEDDASLTVVVGGAFDVSADEGARVEIRAQGPSGQLRLASQSGPDDVLSHRFVHCDLEAGRPPEPSWRYNHHARLWLWDETLLDDVTSKGNLLVRAGDTTVTGGTYGPVTFYTGDLELRGTTVTGGFSARIFGKDVTLGEGTTFASDGYVLVHAGGKLRLAGGAAVRNESKVGSYPVCVLRGAETVVEPASSMVALGTTNATVLGALSVSVGGRIESVAGGVALSSPNADVEVTDDADIACANGTMSVWAAGAVFANDGAAVLSAKEFDIRCATGDLDLDLESMTATGGRVVAVSNGLVRLRGTFTAARDIQVLSLLDSVDVRGATLRTSDSGATPSGFVRLVTYAPTAVVLPVPEDGDDDWSDEDDEESEDDGSDDDEDAKRAAAVEDASDDVTIAASGSTLASGSSDTRSGDVMLQVAASGDAGVDAKFKASSVRSRRAKDGRIETIVKGTMRFAPWSNPFLNGTTRLTAGPVSRRVFLQTGNGTATSPSGTVELRSTRFRARSAAISLRLLEAGAAAAEAGRPARLGLDRAGLHVRTTFTRPKLKRR